jgi:hypothetical protein
MSKQHTHSRVITSLVLLVMCLLLLPQAVASLSLYVSPEQLAQRASLIVEGRVTRTASGYDRELNRLATYISLDVERVHRGPDGLETLVIREPGGRFGGLVNHIDAVPIYKVDETVLVFLEATPDGALRTTGMFFGKFTILEQAERGARMAQRNLEGQGHILGRSMTRNEQIELADLVAVALTVTPQRRTQASQTALTPPEFDRLAWDPGIDLTALAATAGSDSPNATLALASESLTDTAQFELLSSSSPTRWMETDSDSAVVYRLDPANDPLGDAGAATALIETALASWTDVPESRVTLQLVDSTYDYTGTHSLSPALNYSGTHVILFDDPYDDISDPVGCSGVLAIGGYWRTDTIGATVNGVDFYPAMQSYVILNNNFECFLDSPDNLAEVATHELGHTLGFGHSTTADAIMRSAVYGGRGARLGDDDRDIAHCTYPHSLMITSPNGGEAWPAGSQQTISWDSTTESGPSTGEVELEYSIDGGATWNVIAVGTPNDGSFSWSVPGTVGTDLRVRVLRGSLAGDTPTPFSTLCSFDLSDGAFSILPATILAGAIDNSLLIDKAVHNELRLSWSPSCSGDVDDHAIYQGLLSDLRAGVLSPLPQDCSAGVDLAEYIVPAAQSVYFLVVPLAGSSEGALGVNSSGSPRVTAGSSCAVRESDSVCY